MTSVIRLLGAVLFCLVPILIAAGQDGSFTAIDRHALAASPYAEESLDQLAAYLMRPARSDREKVRAIYRWMTDRISYDVGSFLQGHPGELRPEGVLWRRRAVCSGYTALFTALCQRAGVETVTLNGYARGATHGVALHAGGSNHAWNAVKLDGQWHLLDVTWSAGYVNGTRFVKRYQESFFLTPPAQLVLTHFPQDPRWQLLQPPLSRAQFDSLPPIDPPVFELGIPVEALWKAVQSGRGVVKVYDHDGPVIIHAAPITSRVDAGREYYFRIEAPRAVSMAVIDDGQFIFLQRNGPHFEGAVRPRTGNLKLGQQRHPADRTFQTILGYGR